MNSKPTVIFDFDGTLVDTLDILKNIYNNIAPMYGTRQISQEEIERIRDGRDTKKVLREFGISFFKLPKILAEVRRQFKMNLGAVAFHPGVPEMIRSLKANGYRLGILSSNSVEAVHEVLIRQNLDDAFDFIYSNKKIFKKHQNLQNIIKKHRLSKNNVIYVGDETRDINASNIIGIPCIGVGWGFQTTRVLHEAHATQTIETPEQMLSVIQDISRAL